MTKTFAMIILDSVLTVKLRSQASPLTHPFTNEWKGEQQSAEVTDINGCVIKTSLWPVAVGVMPHVKQPLQL